MSNPMPQGNNAPENPEELFNALWESRVRVKSGGRRLLNTESEEMIPLLDAAEAMRSLPRPTLSAREKTALRGRVLDAFKAQKHRPALVPRLLILATMMILIVFGAVAVFGVSSTALPGDTLYGVKRFSERMRLSLSRGEDYARISYEQAELRLSELDMLVALGNEIPSAVLTEAISSINTALSTEKDPARRQILLRRTGNSLRMAESLGRMTGSAAREAVANLTVSVEEAPFIGFGEIDPTPSGDNASRTPDPVISSSPTADLTPTGSFTPTETLTYTPTLTPTLTLTWTATTLPTATPTLMPTATLTETPSPTLTKTPTGSAIKAPVATKTPPRRDPTRKPTNTPRPKDSNPNPPKPKN